MCTRNLQYSKAFNLNSVIYLVCTSDSGHMELVCLCTHTHQKNWDFKCLSMHLMYLKSSFIKELWAFMWPRGHSLKELQYLCTALCKETVFFFYSTFEPKWQFENQNEIVLFIFILWWNQKKTCCKEMLQSDPKPVYYSFLYKIKESMDGQKYWVVQT